MDCSIHFESPDSDIIMNNLHSVVTWTEMVDAKATT